jgi:hypothetical protein
LASKWLISLLNWIPEEPAWLANRLMEFFNR